MATQHEEDVEQQEKPKPVWSRRYRSSSGVIEIAVWRRMITVGEGEDQKEVPTWNTSMKKTYLKQNGKGKKPTYEVSNFYRQDELGIIALAMNTAFNFISDASADEATFA